MSANTLSSDYPFWYAFSTASRAEKRIRERLLSIGIECWVPIQRTLKQWSDRKQWVEEPLVRGYIFVPADPKIVEAVKHTRGVRRAVRSNGMIAIIPHKQLLAVQSMIHTGQSIDVEETIVRLGVPVRVIRGPMQGCEGIVVSRAGKYKLALSVEAITTTFSVQIPIADVEYLEPDQDTD